MSKRRETLNTDYLNNINAGISILIGVMIIANSKELEKQNSLNSTAEKYSDLMDSNLKLSERSIQLEILGE